MSISTVVTRGYGSFGTINHVPVRGYLPGTPPPPAPVRQGGGAGRAFYWTPEDVPKKRKSTAVKKLLKKIAVDDSAAARKILERQARQASDAIAMIRDVQAAVRELENEIGKKARELEIAHRWAEEMIQRLEDEKLILLLLLQEA